MKYHPIHYGTAEIDSFLKARLTYFTSNREAASLPACWAANMGLTLHPSWAHGRDPAPQGHSCPYIPAHLCLVHSPLLSWKGGGAEIRRQHGKKKEIWNFLYRIKYKNRERMHGILNRGEEIWCLESLTWQNSRVRKEAGVQTVWQLPSLLIHHAISIKSYKYGKGQKLNRIHVSLMLHVQ